MSGPIELAALNDLGRDEFTATLAGVFEHSPWIAQAAWAARPFAGVSALHAEMIRVVQAAGGVPQLDLIRAHPELAGKLAVGDALTAESISEQAGAGLDQCTAEEFARFGALNAAYKERFDMPFIMAVAGRDRHAILEAFAARTDNPPDVEFATAISEIGKIAGFRLRQLVKE